MLGYNLLGSVFRIRKFLVFSDPDQLVRGTDPDHCIISSKNIKKDLDFYTVQCTVIYTVQCTLYSDFFMTFYLCWMMEIYLQKVKNKNIRKKFFFAGILKVTWRNKQEPDPDLNPNPDL